MQLLLPFRPVTWFVVQLANSKSWQIRSESILEIDVGTSSGIVVLLQGQEITCPDGSVGTGAGHVRNSANMHENFHLRKLLPCMGAFPQAPTNQHKPYTGTTPDKVVPKYSKISGTDADGWPTQHVATAIEVENSRPLLTANLKKKVDIICAPRNPRPLNVSPNYVIQQMIVVWLRLFLIDRIFEQAKRHKEFLPALILCGHLLKPQEIEFRRALQVCAGFACVLYLHACIHH